MTDVYSWGESDQFEEDDSWMSEPESVCNNWRGWKKCTTNSTINLNGANVHGSGHCGASTSGLAVYNGIGGLNGALLNSLNLQAGSNSTVGAAAHGSASLTTTGASSVLGSLSSAANPHRPSSPTYAILNSSLRG